ncbi:putative axonemal dynein intermediate chain inner arm i1 [Schistosoma mansoni]|uniref:putative axonemal dynein intermediate chain inner arm i1 n=1 Tax=Schistosoma mansoni TaxID=6183 RepID=UPI0001A64469|nr:putative axonemal dynein intermediate chain inner arm i1 [Schistosoma mansoni]|eukprot:XP_018654442.1 putative axonemal dynein intermediate chain inner arm i1 [Schistosoma mansoni]
MSGVHRKGQKIRKSALMIRRRVSSSFSKKSDSEKRLSRATIRLIDESGVDLTPLPLLSEDKRIREEKDTMLITSKIGNDQFIEHGMNTLNLPLMNKLIQTECIHLKDKSCMASNWDMVDTYEKEIEEKEEETKRNLLPDNTMNTNSESDLIFIHDNAINQLNQLTNELGLLETPKMKNDLNNMERALNINLYRDKLFKYQSLLLKEYQSNMDSGISMKPSPEMSQTFTNSTSNDHLTRHEASMSKASLSTSPLAPTIVTTLRNLGSVNSIHSTLNDSNTTIRSSELSKKQNISPQIPHVIPLWRFQCSMTKGHNISDMAWNKQNPNILAIGYGQFEYDNQQKGLVCCWSLKLIEYPERYYTTPSSVTAIGWSNIHANLLAVGMFNGVVFVYDVRKNDPLPVIDTTHATGRHLGPVRKLQWIFKESSLAENLQEVLVSVSNDGRVTQWFIRKGFESADLMILKQTYSSVLTPMNTSQRSEALISRTAFATSMAFNKRDLSGQQSLIND